MTKADIELVNDAIVKHGDDTWNDSHLNYEGDEQCAIVRWVIVDLLALLEKDGLDLKIIRKKR